MVVERGLPRPLGFTTTPMVTTIMPSSGLWRNHRGHGNAFYLDACPGGSATLVWSKRRYGSQPLVLSGFECLSSLRALVPIEIWFVHGVAFPILHK